VSQENKDKADPAEARTKQTRGFMQRIRVASKRKYTSEEIVRIVLEGFHREMVVNELCRREGIKPGAFYAWIKGFIGIGKEGLPEDLKNRSFFIWAKNVILVLASTFFVQHSGDAIVF